MHDTLKNHAMRLAAATGAVLLFFTALSPSAQAGKPASGKLDSALCASWSGTWTAKPDTCTIGVAVTVQASFVIPAGVSLLIPSTAAPVGGNPCIFSIPSGVTMSNSGTVTIQNTAVGNGTVGICNEGTITNSNAINISNSGTSGGILNGDILNDDIAKSGTMTNAGTIAIALAGGAEIEGFAAVGIENLRSVSNSGTITVSTSQDVGYGIYGIRNNYGIFTNEASGTLTNNIGPGAVGDATRAGLSCDEGAIINHGVINNNGLFKTWAWVMLNYGTINNNSTGTLYRALIDAGKFTGEWANYGTILNKGTIDSDKLNDLPVEPLPHGYGTCTNVVDTAGKGCELFARWWW